VVAFDRTHRVGSMTGAQGRSASGPKAIGSHEEASILIIGAGLAGCLLAHVAARGGASIFIFDVSRQVKRSLKIERFSASQVEILDHLGLLDIVKNVTWRDESGVPVWRENCEPPVDQCGFLYDYLVGQLRSNFPESVEFVPSRVTAIFGDGRSRTVQTQSGAGFSGKVIVDASGRSSLIPETEAGHWRLIRSCHSVIFGFTVRSLVNIGNHCIYVGKGSGIDRVEIFPLFNKFRVKIYTYFDFESPLIVSMRDDPIFSLKASAPTVYDVLRGCVVDGKVEISRNDLRVENRTIAPGVASIGDSYATTDPLCVDGVTRILRDIALLDREYFPRWLSADVVSDEHVGQFNSDPFRKKSINREMKFSISRRMRHAFFRDSWRLFRRMRSFNLSVNNEI